MGLRSHGEGCPDYECSEDHFPCRKRECILEHVWRWLSLLQLLSQPETLTIIHNIRGVMMMT
ncbi:MAG: hypothetical protein QXH35_07635 [Nitrososphaerota archaeon]